uniref:Cell division cycle associated 4 n=1 Tax=Poecilia reticulata TaxID=8081 RepID=A0A3P9NGL0_POERE
MFPKGTKRKFSDSGEEAVCGGGGGGDQGPSAAPAPSPSPAAARTLSSSYSLQRQSLLDMSLIKLQLCHMLVEPNLCRSVLIANTVRQIQEEMTQDGTWQIMTQALAAAQCPADRLVATEVLCRQTEAAAQEGYHSEEVVMDGDAEAEVAMSSLSPVSPQLSSASYLAGADSRTGEQVFGTFEIKHPAPPSDPALEELFSDVDPSYYDLDTVLTGMQSTPKMGPYDLLESLSSHGPTALSSSTTCRSDLNELDHIMEIIVGS